MVSVSEAVIARFGGLSGMAQKMTEALGKNVAPSTVQHWKERGYFPHWRHDEILRTARHFNIPLTPQDFVIPPEPVPAE